MNNKIKGYRDLIVWQKAMLLSVEVYRTTSRFPRSELYGLVSQMRRSAISIPSNIAEGSLRFSRKDFRRFLLIAFGSGAELETQLELSQQLGFINKKSQKITSSLLDEIMRMLNKMTNSLKSSC